ncbi:MAG TPA: hypothetical protein IGS17_10270 [Oscillatoriales cyanobacterium M59_W2019_021]|nr:hypothetical protein [Oscillatoriales cyanobacterium M4454_W2019_049]HIK51290.1 hypothetical protein [Oscillatoriales cyanobacterium M59_W2019_021]
MGSLNTAFGVMATTFMLSSPVLGSAAVRSISTPIPQDRSSAWAAFTLIREAN